MNNDRRMKRLQKKQAKQKYKEYKKNKNHGRIKMRMIITSVILLVTVVALAYVYTHQKVEEEIIEKEEGNLTIEKVGDESDVLVESDTDEVVGKTDEEVSSQVESYMNSMNVESRVAQLFMITPEELTGIGIVVQAGETTQSKLKEYAVGGLIFSDQNIEVIDQLKLMLNSIEAYTSAPIFLAVDVDGVQRVTNTNNTLAEVGFDMSFDEELYLVVDGKNEPVGNELNVVVVEDITSNDVMELVINGAELLVVTEDFTDIYDDLLAAVRAGELEEEILEERVRAIMTYKVENGL